MKRLLLALILLSNLAMAQIAPDLQKRDFASLFLEKDNGRVLGFIGADYQRIRVKFISIIRNPTVAGEYRVFGKTMVKDNVCDFQGTLTITKAAYKKIFEEPGAKQGSLTGTYVFYEDPSQKHVGTFKGTFSADWYIDKTDALRYDDFMIEADGYSNNRFNGTWSSYGGALVKPCNWGDYRIPNSGDLDGGAGEFMPGEKYLTKGWQNYYDMIAGDNAARAREEAAWWK